MGRLPRDVRTGASARKQIGAGAAAGGVCVGWIVGEDVVVAEFQYVVVLGVSDPRAYIWKVYEEDSFKLVIVVEVPDVTVVELPYPPPDEYVMIYPVEY
jgi:hypothetical protein